MVNSLVQAMCLMAAAATTAVATPYDYDQAHAYASEVQDRSAQWPFSELIQESPFEFHRRREQEQGQLATAGSRTQNQLPPCASETPVGWGDKVNNPDTAAAFSAYAPFQTIAKNLGVSNASFTNQSVNSNAAFEFVNNTYLGWINQPTYSPWNCSLACNALNATGVKCNSYNTYFLRSPSLTPSTGTDTSCPNPASMTTIVCALWRNKLYYWDGINIGEMRGKGFQVVISGSNLYQRNNSDPL